MIPLTLPVLERASALVGPWWRALVGAAIVAAPVFLIGQCSGASHERAKARAATAVAVATAVSRNAGLTVAAGAERAVDTAKVANLTEELTNAVVQVPDTTPDPVAVRLGCERLRLAGRDVAAVPACRGPGGGGQAGAER